MGCDIHFHVERRTDNGWESASSPASYVQALRPLLPDWWDDLTGVPEWDMRRLYDLFDALSGVRCATTGRWEPIGRLATDEPKSVVSAWVWDHAHALCPGGLPDDMAPETEKDRAKWEGDAHSDGHGTLRELMDERIAHAGGPQWVLLLSHLTPLAEGDLDSVRGVWWFDN